MILAAAVAGASVWLLRPAWSRLWESPIERGLRTLAEASGPRRFTEARLSGPFEWAQAPEPTREASARGGFASRAVERAAIELRALTSGERSAAALRGTGVAYLAERDIDRAIAAFEDALRLDPAFAAARVDLSAAFIERWRRDGEAADAARALNEAERASQLEAASRPARFNRALALEALALKHEAGRAWRAYLEGDDGSDESEWGSEARQRAASLSAAATTEARARPDVRRLSDAELDTLARQQPLTLYRVLERDILPAWGARILAGERGGQGVDAKAKPATSSDLADASRVARALERAGRDRAIVDLTDLAARADREQSDARPVFAQAFVLLDRWWHAYDSSAYTEANRLASEAGEHLRRAGAPSAEADVRVSIVDVARGRTADGIARLEAIEEVARAGGYNRILAVTAQLRGLAAMQRSAIDDAVGAYQTARRASDAAGDTELAALTTAYLGTAHWTQGNGTAAWRDFSEAGRLLPAVASARRGFQVFSRSAELAQQSGLPGAALAIADALLHDPVQRQFAWTRVASLFRARALAAMGGPGRAAADLESARLAANQIPDPAYRAEVSAEVAITTGQTLVTADPPKAIAALTEGLEFQRRRTNQFRTASLLLTRGRAYAHSGDNAHAEADWLDGVALLEDTRLSIRDAQLRIARTADTWQLFEELVQVQRDRPHQALQTMERAHARELMDSIARDTNLEAFRDTGDYSWLPPRSTALVYAVGAARLLIWEVTAGSVKLHERAIASTALADLVDRSVKAIREGREPDPSLAATVLPDSLSLSPGEIDNLIVVPDGSLYQLPFGPLRAPRSGTRLIDASVITVSPSLAVLKVLHERPRWTTPSSPLLVGVGLANPKERLPALPGVETELRGLRAFYPDAEILSGADARPERVLEKLASADLLHFAGHAVSDEVHPARSRLMLAPGGASAVLRPADIAAARMRSGGVVILGACDTAAGVAFKGEGPLNLARPFLIGGAASVIATLWPVVDADAIRLLLEVHQLIGRGVAPGRALAMVQRRTPEKPGGVKAAFVLIGRM